MSYNGSGTFVINSTGQPVITGTIISSSTFNSLTADLGTGLSTAITKDGQTTTTAKIPFALGISAAVASNFAAGTVAAPSIYLSTDTATGFYRIGLNNTGFAINGTKLLDLSATLLAVTGGITATTSIISTTPIYQYKKSASTTIATSSGENIVFAPGASKTIVVQIGNTAGGFLVIVNRQTDGAGAVFYAEYKSATPVKLAGDSNFVVAGSATAAQVAFTKGSNSASFSVITGSGYTGNMTIYVNGTYVTGTVDPA